MSSPLSKKREGTARLFPGTGVGTVAVDLKTNGDIISYNSHSQSHVFKVNKDPLLGGTSKVETATALGRREGTACLFPRFDCDTSSRKRSEASSGSTSTQLQHSSGATQSTISKSFGDNSGACSAAHQQNTLGMSSLCSSTHKIEERLQVEPPFTETATKTTMTTTTTKYSMQEIRKVPAKALNVATRKRLSLLLLPPKLTGKDWKGLAELMGFEYLNIDYFDQKEDPVKSVLDEWTCFRDSTIEALLDMLKELDREDVLMDIQPLVEKDATRWIERRKNAVQVPEVSGSYPNLPDEPSLRGITLDDHPSGPPEVFDAYVCFTYADKEFVMEMMSVLEKAPYNLKLCVDFRDLVPGGSYSTVTAELIENRCKRMIIVLSPDFLASEDCDFQTKFAHSIAPSARTKRLIPVMVERCSIPSILRHVTVCDYTKTDLRQWFWKRLYCSLKST